MICLTDFTYRYYMFGNRENGLNDLNLKAMDAEQLREHGHKMVDFIADYYKNIENFPVLSQVEPGYLQKLLPDSAPLLPESLQAVLQGSIIFINSVYHYIRKTQNTNTYPISSNSDVETKILPSVTHWQSPNFYAYFPANSSVAGFLGEMVSRNSSDRNRYNIKDEI